MDVGISTSPRQPAIANINNTETGIIPHTRSRLAVEIISSIYHLFVNLEGMTS